MSALAGSLMGQGEKHPAILLLTTTNLLIVCVIMSRVASGAKHRGASRFEVWP